MKRFLPNTIFARLFAADRTGDYRQPCDDVYPGREFLWP